MSFRLLEGFLTHGHAYIHASARVSTSLAVSNSMRAGRDEGGGVSVCHLVSNNVVGSYRSVIVS